MVKLGFCRSGSLCIETLSSSGRLTTYDDYGTDGREKVAQGLPLKEK